MRKNFSNFVQAIATAVLDCISNPQMKCRPRLGSGGRRNTGSFSFHR
jgi:hypothetical protein